MTSVIHVGDCRDVMRQMEANSVDAIVTDPPYHLSDPKRGAHAAATHPSRPHGRSRISDAGFMGLKWDGGDVAFRSETWAEALRVAKPGAYLLAFGGTRTSHRMVSAIEDAGWEIRDDIARFYTGDEDHDAFFDSLDEQQRELFMRAFGQPSRLEWVYGNGFPKSKNLKGDREGWGTALKPAHEPIVLARKPLSGTVQQNVRAYGTGALNIDGSRIDVADEHLRAGAGVIPCRHASDERRQRSNESSAKRRYADRGVTDIAAAPGPRGGDTDGRWPANVIHDGSDEVLAAFPGAPGQRGAVTGTEPTANGFSGAVTYSGMLKREPSAAPRLDAGSAARFFYCAKPSKAEREMGLESAPKQSAGMRSNTSGARITAREGYDVSPRANNHPTVKPIALMRYLCRMVTPPGGVVLDLFTGSGSTGCAAVAEGFRFVGIELNERYAAIADRRIAAVQPGLELAFAAE